MYFFSSVFLTILKIFSLEVTLIRDQGWINVGAYGPLFFLNRLMSFLSKDKIRGNSSLA